MDCFKLCLILKNFYLYFTNTYFQEYSVSADVRTKVMNLMVDFCNFVNASQNMYILIVDRLDETADLTQIKIYRRKQM
jgi:hypothetical protein